MSGDREASKDALGITCHPRVSVNSWRNLRAPIYTLTLSPKDTIFSD